MAIGDSFGPDNEFTVVQMVPPVIRYTGPLSDAYLSRTLFAAAGSRIEHSPADFNVIHVSFDHLKPEWQRFFSARRAHNNPRRSLGLIRAINSSRRASEIEFLRELYRQSNDALQAKARSMLANHSEAQVARWVVRKRNELKVDIRSRGPALFRKLAEWRNRRRYGDPVGPSYSQLRNGRRAPGQPRAGPRTDVEIVEDVARTSRAFNAGARALRLVSLSNQVVQFVLVAAQNSPAALDPLPQSEETQVETERARLRLGIPANANIDRHGHLKSSSYLQIDPMDIGHIGGEIDQETEEILWWLGFAVDYQFEGVHWSVPGNRLSAPNRHPGIPSM